jgi:hypothetical protein
MGSQAFWVGPDELDRQFGFCVKDDSALQIDVHGDGLTEPTDIMSL